MAKPKICHSIESKQARRCWKWYTKHFEPKWIPWILDSCYWWRRFHFHYCFFLNIEIFILILICKKSQVITVGREGEVAAFLSWHNPHPFMINYVGVCTGWGAAGSWVIDGNFSYHLNRKKHYFWFYFHCIYRSTTFIAIWMARKPRKPRNFGSST